MIEMFHARQALHAIAWACTSSINNLQKTTLRHYFGRGSKSAAA
jgi:hypothetical protein